MKKLFALLMVAGTFAMYSCGGEHKEEAAADSTAWAGHPTAAYYSATAAAKAAAHAARLSFYKHMAEKLLELLQLAPHLDTAR